MAIDLLRYRPEIDGLRAIAVLSVVAYHYGASWLPGGFAGVDLFFVISGYLISQRLSAEIYDGSFSLLNFYDRRLRRILPAFAVMIMATLAAGYFMLLPGDYKQSGISSAYSASGFGNLYFYWHTGYFDRNAEMLPLLHTWSLGVEEQFYVAWPLLLFAILKLFRRRIFIVAAIAVVTAASFAFGLYLLGSDPKAAFYLPFGRGWELAAGAILVFLAPPERLMAFVLSMTGLVLIVLTILWITASDSFPGWLALMPASGAALLIYSSRNTWVGNLLSLGPMRFTGLISYSLYLWHWPLLIFFRQFQNSLPLSWHQAVPLAFCAYGLATFSWWFIEKPFRRHCRQALPPGIVVIAALTITGLLIYKADGLPSRVPDQVNTMGTLEEMWRWECPRVVTLPGMAYTSCTFGRDWYTPGPKAVIWGDSHAEHLAPIFEAAIHATNSPYAFVLISGCPSALGGNVRRTRPDYPQYVSNCTTIREAALRVLHDDTEVNLIILSASWAALSTVVDLKEHMPETTREAVVASGVIDAVERGKAAKRRFVIVTDSPSTPFDPIPCFVGETSGLFRRRCTTEEKAILRSAQLKRTGSMTHALETIAARRDDIEILNLVAVMCPSEQCLTTVDGEFLYRDSGHFRRNLTRPTLETLASLFGFDRILQETR